LGGSNARAGAVYTHWRALLPPTGARIIAFVVLAASGGILAGALRSGQ